MLKKTNAAKSVDNLFDLNRTAELVDTSLLVEELRNIYKQRNQPIEVDFRKLVKWVRPGDQLTHQIHPYPAKLFPHIAHFFVRASLFHRQNRRVLDPFCGSGTVALETSLAGYIPYVADANPLALLITKVKTTPYESEALLETMRKILSRTRCVKTAPEVPVVNHHLWYTPATKKALEKLLCAVMETEDEVQRDFFRVCFSVTIRRLSQADPVISVPVRLRTKDKFSERVNAKIKNRLDWIKNAIPLDEFRKVCEGNIERVNKTNNALPNRIPAVEVGIDARQLYMPGINQNHPLESESIPLIVASPPYGSAQKYIRATSLSLNWLGLARPDELVLLEGKSIGREHVPLYRGEDIEEQLPNEYERLLSVIQKKNDTRARITRRYLHEMKSALTEMTRVTSLNGHIVLVVGNNQVCEESLRNDKYVTHVLQELGLKLEISLIDHIKSRGLMTKRNRAASVISRECVLVFTKQ